MPPKKGKKAKKAELERKAREEEELRRKEEEERLEAERLVKQREEEKRALERRIEARNDEVDRFVCHVEEMSARMAARTALLKSLRKKQHEVAEWQGHVGCNEAEWPDVDTANLNTYATEIDENLSFKAGDVTKCINTIDRVLAELEYNLLEKKQEEQGSEKLIEFSFQLQRVLLKKIDAITAQMLKESRNTNTERGTLAFDNGATKYGVVLCLSTQNSEGHGEDTCLDLSSIGIRLDISGQLCRNDYAVRICRFPFEACPRLRYVCGDLTMGGVFHVEMVRMPSPEMALADGWTLCNDAYANSEQSNERSVGTPTFLAPIKCSVRLPSNIIVDSPSSLLAATWNGDEERWSSKDSSGLEYDVESRTVSFQLSAPGMVGILQSRQIDLDYKSWSLGPIKANGEPVVKFKLVTPRFQVVLHISGSNCTLVAPDIPELSKLKGISQSPAQLLAKLSRSGLHLLPMDSDAAKMERTMKMHNIEERACGDVSILSTAFSIESSRFNSLLGRGQICYEIRESDTFTGGCDPSPMATALVEIDSESASARNAPGAKEVPAHCGNIRCSIVKGAEEGPESIPDTKFNTAAKDGTESSLFMSQCVPSLSSSEAMERVWSSSPLISETVKQVLELTRPFTFC
eukprot:CAMPEP_0197465878 /NCGR_PEP_ID=MMETSP1175-20131217/64765_1 /TAXON_ID=1003142 /ORGANISM="Triceratium dubium, Strain CCMP147" /LENGTH=632 /DNA_ID=CAMNT_0043001901 /DNA_START=232 /DNA_END=2130 /DNA_ORIENTATION=+